MSREQTREVARVVEHTQPCEHSGLSGHLWTVKKVREWIFRVFGAVLSRGTVRRILREAGLSWKKVRKLLGKAKPGAREAHVERIFALFEKSCCDEEVILIWVDEAHVHRDLDLGYGWSIEGKRLYRKSDCPSLSQRLNFYGAYDFSHGECLLWQEGNCNGAKTATFLEKIKKWREGKKGRIVIVWDNSPVHRAGLVKEKAKELGIELEWMPGYSPDLNPIERLWAWMRQEVTHGHCHANLQILERACQQFIAGINACPEAVRERLCPVFDLDPEVEAKLLVST